MSDLDFMKYGTFTLNDLVKIQNKDPKLFEVIPLYPEEPHFDKPMSQKDSLYERVLDQFLKIVPLEKINVW